MNITESIITSYLNNNDTNIISTKKVSKTSLRMRSYPDLELNRVEFKHNNKEYLAIGENEIPEAVITKFKNKLER